jgi:CubicO group peptidase (beta-lactamase class C family)
MAQSGFHLADITTTNLAVAYRCAAPHTLTYAPYSQYGYADYPCGCMRTSANALSIWLRCFMNGGTFDGTRILKASTVREIRRPQLKGIAWGQGLIWYRIHEAGNQLIGHNGGDYGVSTNMYFAPERHVGVVTLTNRYVGTWSAWYAFLDIQDRLLSLL